MAKRTVTSITIDGTSYNLMVLDDLSVLDSIVVYGIFNYEAPYYEEWACTHNTDFAAVKSDASSTTFYDTNLQSVKFLREVSGQNKYLLFSDTNYQYASGEEVSYNGSGTQVYYSIILDDDVQEAWIVTHEYQNNAYTRRTVAYGDSNYYNAWYIEATPPTPPVPHGDAKCKITYYLPYDDYEYAKITYKNDTEPENVDDGESITIVKTDSYTNINNLLEGQLYWFKIFTNKSESNGFPYVVGPVITDWVNAELPSPMVIGEMTKPYKFEDFTTVEHITSKEAHELGFLFNKYNGTEAAWLFDDVIPSGSVVNSFWLFGNRNRGIYIDYRYVDQQQKIICPYFMVYYRQELLIERQLMNIASAPLYGNNIIYAGKNDITKKGSMIVLFSSAGTSSDLTERLYPLLINDTKLYYFITNRPNPDDYEWYIDKINGSGFTWKNWQRESGSGYNKFPFSDYTQWRSDNGDISSSGFDLEANENARVFQTEKTRIDINTSDYITYTAVLNPVGAFEGEYLDGISTYQYYTVGRGYYYRRKYIIQGMTNEINGYPYIVTGNLEDVFIDINKRCKNVSIYVNGDCWSEV